MPLAITLPPPPRAPRSTASRVRLRISHDAPVVGQHTLVSRTIETPLGPMLLLADDAGLRLLDFTDRRGLPRQLDRIRTRLNADISPGDHPNLDVIARELARYFSGRAMLGHGTEPLGVALAPALGASPFQRAVWDQLLTIPLGQTRSYGAQAQAVGRPDAVRAVARANGENFLSLVIPCHRVIGTDGGLTGYGGGLERKRWLLAHEARMAGTTLWAPVTTGESRRPHRSPAP